MAISQDTLIRYFERGARLKQLQARIHEYAGFVQEAHNTRAAQESLTMPLEKMLEATAEPLLPTVTISAGRASLEFVRRIDTRGPLPNNAPKGRFSLTADGERYDLVNDALPRHLIETAYTLLPRLTDLVGKINEGWVAGIERDIFTALQ